VGANLGEALEHLLDQALSHQYPKHPRFGQEIRLGKDLRQVLEVCQEAARTPDGRVFVEDKAVRMKLKNICNPLDLGQMSETHFVLSTFWKTHFNRMLAQSGQTTPVVKDTRRWTDQPEERGLPCEIQNLLVLIYADQTNRSFVRYGSNYTPDLDDLPDELELREQTLPDLKDWQEAVTRVADILGHAISNLLNASNLATLAAKVNESATEFKADCDSLPDRLQLVLKNVAVSEQDAAKADRVRTAKAVRALFEGCDGKEPTALVGTIARAKLETNSTAMGRSVKSAKPMLDCLRTTRWDLFSAVALIDDHRQTDAELLLQDVRSWLEMDEHALAGGLAAKLSEAEGRAIKLLTPPTKKEKNHETHETHEKRKESKTGTCICSTTEELEQIMQELSNKLRANPRYRLTIDWSLVE
jgi:hypothetical protein